MTPPSQEVNEYLLNVVNHVKEQKSFLKSFKESTKQAGFAAGGALVGGVLLGPVGGLVGTVVGGVIGFCSAESYDGLFQAILNLNDEEKQQLVSKIRSAVGKVPITSFINWYQEDSHREILMTLFIMAVSSASQVGAIQN